MKLRMKAQKIVDDWNARYPAGTLVKRYRLINPLEDPVETRTRSLAWIMGGHSAMVLVDGQAGGVVLESVVPNERRLRPDQYVDMGATFDETRRYRYHLWRTWALMGPRVLWVMLNPSTADERVLDPTLRRCEGFSRAWGYSGFDVCNIFAIRGTDPAILKRAQDPVGQCNDAAITEVAAKVDRVVCGWGNDGHLFGRGEKVVDLLRRVAITPPMCLGKTKIGMPKHPLYLAKTSKLEEL